MSARTWLAVAGAVALAGCVSTPVPPLNPPLPHAWANQTSAVGAAVPSRATLAQWWRGFGDAGLDAVEQEALAGNLGLQEAGERVLAARSLAGVADAPWRPNLRFGTDNVVAADKTRSYILPGFDATWELPLFGAAKSARRVAQGEVGGVEGAWRGARVSLAAEVARTWIELRTATAQMQGLESLRSLQQQRVQLEQRRADLGLAAVDEDGAAATALATLEKQISTAREQARISAQRLALLLGRAEPDPAWLANAAPAQWTIPTSDNFPVDQLRHQPAIAEAEAGVVRAAGELGVRKAQMYPHIGLGAALQWVVETTNGSLGSNGAFLSLGPSVDIPLLDWGQRTARKHAAAHQLQAALLAYRQAVLQGVSDVESALIAVQETAKRAQADATLARTAQAAQTRVGQAQELGLADELEVLTTRERVLETAARERSAQTDQILAWVAVYKALGAGAPADAALSPTPDATGAERRAGAR